MTLEIVPATVALIGATEDWLDSEEAQYKATCRAADANGFVTVHPPRGFRCNWDTVKRNWQNGNEAVHILVNNGSSIGFLSGTDILEVRPNERRRGYGRILANFMVKRAFDEGRCLVEIEIAPTSAIPFWQQMGFTLVEGRKGCGGGCYAYRRFDRKFILGVGPKVRCSIEFFNQTDHFSGAAPFYRFDGQGEVLPDSSIQLPERIVCFNPEAARGDPFARITANGKLIFFDKLKRTECAQLGMQRDAGYTYFIERLRTGMLDRL